MMKLLLVALLAFLASRSVLGDDDQPKDPNAEPQSVEEEQPPKPVRRTKKKAEYFSLEEAIKVATEWDCPIVVYVQLQGDPLGGKVRGRVITSDLQKEFIQANCVFASVKVPQWEDPDKKNRRSRQKAALKPDFTKLAGENSTCTQIAVGMAGTANPVNKPTLPQLAVLTSNGRKRLGASVYTESTTDFSLKDTVGMLKTAFEAGKYKCEITPKLQKIIDKEVKLREKAAKRK